MRPVKTRSKKISSEEQVDRIPLLSFFTGGGLLDLGMELAGFDVVWTNELDSVFADMYSFALTNWRIQTGRSSKVAEITCRKSILDIDSSRLVRSVFPSGRPSLFGVIGGPPCPDFSNGGTHAGQMGSSGRLTETFVRTIIDIKPDFFVIENVAGLHRFQKHREFLDQMVKELREDGKFVVDVRVLNALELGVAQSRERVFVIGCRKKIAEKALSKKLLPNQDGWFRWPVIEAYANATNLNWPSTNEFGRTPRKPKSIPLELTIFGAFSFLGDPEQKPNGKEYFNAYSAKFWERAEGDVSGKSFKRLHRYRYSPTVWYGNQEVHLHPWKPRRLSVREAMRIQSVPDEYVLPTEVPLSAKFKMISNGVPCRMAEQLGLQLFDFLRKGTDSRT